MQDFKKLHVWQKAHALALRTYEVSATFPTADRYALSAQMRRAATSIPANIAEGCCRGSRRELAQYLRVALGSAGELESFAALAADMQLLGGDEPQILTAQICEVKRLLTGLLKAVTGHAQSKRQTRSGN